MINPKSRNQNSQYDLISHYVLACFPLSYFDPILNRAVIKAAIRSFQRQLQILWDIKLKLKPKQNENDDPKSTIKLIKLIAIVTLYIAFHPNKLDSYKNIPN